MVNATAHAAGMTLAALPTFDAGHDGRITKGVCGARMTKSVLVLQHVEPEPVGRIAGALESVSASPTIVRVFLGDPVPADLGDASGLIVMGGPMGVYEQDRYPHLADEIRLIQAALKSRKPILGTCLGSQLLASALGSDIRKGKKKEIGWYPVTLSGEAVADPLWMDVPSSFTGFHWHGDVFTLPKGAVSLASSDLTTHQAFRYGGNAYGFLFHMEVTAPMIGEWTRAFEVELAEAGIPSAGILEGIETHLTALQAIGDIVYRRWVSLL
ncbi:MAG: type 1 glutamine amidotransferase [Nitrospirae bacterium]|nr:type 1 glutamine amidotransferase [Nitrospirota bacterium]